MSYKIAVFPGSFDPLTVGHLDIIQRALPLFDKLVIAIGINSDKKAMYSLQDRIDVIKKTFNDEPRIEIKSYSGLTVDFCREIGAEFLVRGLRNPADFEFEKAIAHTNRTMSTIETVFLLTSADKSFVSSSIVREIIKHQGDISNFVPKAVLAINPQ